FNQAERRRIRRVRVQDGAGAGNATMQRCVQEERRYFDRAAALEHVPVEITEQQARGRDLRPEQPFWIDEKAVVPAGRKHAEMVADTLLVVQTGGPAKRGGEVDSRLAQRIADRSTL